MKKKIILSLLCSLNIFLLFGCNKQEVTEEVIQPKELITKINISAESLIPEEPEIVSENSTVVEEQNTITYEKVINYFSFPSINVLALQDLPDSYVYLEDNELTTLLSELSGDYVYLFDKEIETDITVYDKLYAEAKNSSSTDSIFLTEEDLANLIENIDDEPMNDETTEETEEVVTEDESVESENEETESETEELDETEVTDDIVPDDVDMTDDSDAAPKYLFTLYKAKSVSIYNQDQELIIKDATTANELSFILDSE